jgi:hypothetical protein
LRAEIGNITEEMDLERPQSGTQWVKFRSREEAWIQACLICLWCMRRPPSICSARCSYHGDEPFFVFRLVDLRKVNVKQMFRSHVMFSSAVKSSKPFGIGKGSVQQGGTRNYHNFGGGSVLTLCLRDLLLVASVCAGGLGWVDASASAGVVAGAGLAGCV